MSSEKTAYQTGNQAYVCQYCQGGTVRCKNSDHAEYCSGSAFCFEKRCVIQILEEQKYLHEDKEAKYFVQHNKNKYLTAEYDGHGEVFLTPSFISQRNFWIYDQDKYPSILQELVKNCETPMVMVKTCCRSCSDEQKLPISFPVFYTEPAPLITLPCLKLKHSTKKHKIVVKSPYIKHK